MDELARATEAGVEEDIDNALEGSGLRLQRDEVGCGGNLGDGTGRRERLWREWRGGCHHCRAADGS